MYSDKSGNHVLLKVFIIMVTILFVAGCGGVSSAVSDAISACSGMTFAQIQQQNDITDECREAINSLLPSNQNNYPEKMVPLGEQIATATNSPTLYIIGIDSSGDAYTSDNFDGATITVTEGATETELTSAEFSVDTLADLTEDLMSISIVTDYSGSMRDADIDNAALIYTDLFTALPSIYEAEAIVFSDEVTLQQTFTEDQTTILSAVARDDSIERSSTALYDGMGTALGYLTERTRPIKLLVTATDGLENASATYSKSQITSTISDNGVIVVMIGSLFSDVDELSDLAGSNGIYFFAQTYTEARTAMTTFISSLENIVRITVDNTYQNADTISVAIGSNTATFSFSD